MHIAFLNPQGNFDPADSYWSQHPDFGGQLVYVKEVAAAIARLGHRVDIVTRQIVDPDWPEFASPQDGYPHNARLRIVRIPCGPPGFLRKEDLWPWLGTEWAPNILTFYEKEGRLPDAFTAHYADGGLVGALLQRRTEIPFTFTGHSLGAQKMDKLGVTPDNLEALDQRYHFRQRLLAERVAMNRAGVIITSTRQERMEQYAHPAYAGAVDVTDDRRFRIIPPGVNLAIFADDVRNEQEAATQAHIEAMITRDLTPERRDLPLILASSRLDAKKNHIGLLKAFAGSSALQARANLAIAVRGAEKPFLQLDRFTPDEQPVLRACKKVLDQNQLWDKVTTFSLNSQQALAAAYRYLARRHSIFCLPALYEPFGLAPLEAMAAGLPVVVTRNGGPSESLQDATTGERFGILIDPADPADIARGLLIPLEHPSEWRRLHEAGMRRVHERYTWEQTGSGYLAAIHDMQKRIESIHPWFTHPDDNTIPLSLLKERYFKL